MAAAPEYVALLSALHDSDTANTRWAKRQEQNRLRDLRFARRGSAAARNLLNDFADAKEEKVPALVVDSVFGDGGGPPPPPGGGGIPHIALPNRPRNRPHPYWNVIPRVRNTIRAFSVAKGLYDLGKLYNHGFADEKGDSALRESRIRMAREERLAGHITQNEARKRIDDANLRHAGSSVYRVAQRAPGIALGAMTGSYDPISAIADIATVAPNTYSTISSGLKYVGSKMGFDPAGLPDYKSYFDASARRFQTSTPYGVLGGHVPVSGHQPRFVKCRGGIC